MRGSSWRMRTCRPCQEKMRGSGAVTRPDYGAGCVSFVDFHDRHVIVSTEQGPVVGMRTTVARRLVRESSTDAERTSAFQELADQNLFASYQLANAILGDPSESQDAVHDAVVIAWQRWGSLRDQAKFRAWFQRIVVNNCRDRLRRASKLQTTDIDKERTLVGADPSQEVLERVHVEQALLRLDPDDRLVIALRHYQDLKIENIAELLDVPTSTANSRLRTARNRLRTTLEASTATGAPR